MRRGAATVGCALWLLAASVQAQAGDSHKAKPGHHAWAHKAHHPAVADDSTTSDKPVADPPPVEAPTAAPPTVAPTDDPNKAQAEAAAALPAGHEPVIAERVDPRDSVKTGELVKLEISAVVPTGDDVTIADQPFTPFEVHKKLARVEPPNNGKQRFVFNLELLALEPGDKPIPSIELRVVTKENFVGSVKTASIPYKIHSLVANEPNAQPKRETKPVAVLQDNYIPIYLLGGLLAAALIAALTLLASRWLRARKVAAIPPPPPRPPWEIAVEKLAELRRQKQAMLEAGQGALFIDQLSDVVRAYLGGRYAFDGLETTSDEMLMQLKAHGAPLGFTQEVGQFLGRCDLVKFAKLEPDEDEVDLLLAKGQDLVHFSEPAKPTDTGTGNAPSAKPPTPSTSAPRDGSADPLSIKPGPVGERQP